MEHLELLLRDEAYDSLVHQGLPECGDMKVAVKLNATAGGQAAVVLAWSVRLEDGEVRQVQAVTTAALFLQAARGVAAYLEAKGLAP